MVIFGIDGDLAKRKLLPAVYNLMAGQFPGALDNAGEEVAILDGTSAVMLSGETAVGRPASAAISYPGFFADLEGVRA